MIPKKHIFKQNNKHAQRWAWDRPGDSGMERLAKGGRGGPEEPRQGGICRLAGGFYEQDEASPEGRGGGWWWRLAIGGLRGWELVLPEPLRLCWKHWAGFSKKIDLFLSWTHHLNVFNRQEVNFNTIKRQNALFTSRNQLMKLTAHRAAEPDGALGSTWSWDWTPPLLNPISCE